MTNLSELPKDLPIPVDDGACAHLPGKTIPSINLPLTNGEDIQFARYSSLCVLYFYPMTGRPGIPLPDGWDSIPGARGCTPQSCAFRDHYQELQEYQCGVYGVSTQDSDYQREAKDRLHLPFELISDQDLQLKTALKLPTFEANEQELYKRFTLIIEHQKIVNVFYPIFPSDRNPDDVLEWLKNHRS